MGEDGDQVRPAPNTRGCSRPRVRQVAPARISAGSAGADGASATVIRVRGDEDGSTPGSTAAGPRMQPFAGYGRTAGEHGVGAAASSPGRGALRRSRLDAVIAGLPVMAWVRRSEVSAFRWADIAAAARRRVARAAAANRSICDESGTALSAERASAMGRAHEAHAGNGPLHRRRPAVALGRPRDARRHPCQRSLMARGKPAGSRPRCTPDRRRHRAIRVMPGPATPTGGSP